MCVTLMFPSSFPTLGRTAFQSTLSSWPSWSCWARQPSRLSPTTVSTPPPGCTPPHTATNKRCASEAVTGRSWHTRTHITLVHCTTGVRWVTQIYIWVWTYTHSFVFLIVFLCCRRAQGRRGRCWSLTLRCPTRSPSLMWLCPILERGTRNLVSKLARSATTVNQAGVICRKKSHGHFLHAGRKLHSRLTWCHIFISRFTYSSVPSSKHWFFHTHIFTQTVSVTRTFISRHWHTYTVFSRAVHKCIDCQPCPQLHTFISFIPLWRSDWCCHSRIHVWLYIYWSMHFTSSHTSESSSEIHHISVTFTYHIVLYYHQTSICCIVVNFLFVDVILLL